MQLLSYSRTARESALGLLPTANLQSRLELFPFAETRSRISLIAFREWRVAVVPASRDPTLTLVLWVGDAGRGLTRNRHPCNNFDDRAVFLAAATWDLCCVSGSPRLLVSSHRHKRVTQSILHWIVPRFGRYPGLVASCMGCQAR